MLIDLGRLCLLDSELELLLDPDPSTELRLDNMELRLDGPELKLALLLGPRSVLGPDDDLRCPMLTEREDRLDADMVDDEPWDCVLVRRRFKDSVWEALLVGPQMEPSVCSLPVPPL